MSWSNYLYNKKLNIAIEISKVDYNDITEDIWADLDEYIDYMTLDNPYPEVISYLWNRMYVSTAFGLLVSLFRNIYGDDWEIIGENEITKTTKVIRRK